MKNLLLPVLALFLLVSTMAPMPAAAKLIPQNKETIVMGQVNNGVATFTVDTKLLRSDLQHFISQGLKMPVAFTDVKINFDAGASTYYLVATGAVKGGPAVRTTLHVREYAGCLFIGGEPVTTCTTTGATAETVGCQPVATACTTCPGGAECTKTVSSTPRALFVSIPLGSCQ